MTSSRARQRSLYLTDEEWRRIRLDSIEHGTTASAEMIAAMMEARPQWFDSSEKTGLAFPGQKTSAAQ